jgi:predicted phage terminase large subunit-like protein
LVNTRWSTLDLSGRLLEAMGEGGDYWDVVSLPALAEENDLLNRKVGEALWPSLFPCNVLMEKKGMVGSYWWSALYQQRPSPLGGGLLKSDWIQFYKSLPKSFVTYQAWDLAISEKTSADYTVSCTIGVDEVTGDIYILDWTRDRLDFPSQLRKVQEKANQYNPALIALESTAYQAALPQTLRQTTNLPIKEIKPIRDKVTRIQTTFVAFENGKVYLKKEHPLNDVFLEEFTYFPKSKHDDMLDATQMAIALVNVGGNPYTESYQYYEGSRHHERVLADWRSRHRKI